jgi:gliding motility-associated-like protein
MEAFTPNGDGINDSWLVTSGNCLKSAKAQVFNRYGAKVFESNDYNNDWKGTFEGKPLPDGTYYFVISYQLLTGKMEYLKGNVTILR